MLYVGLIVVCCQGQQLYRTIRTRSSTDESLAVAKSVGLATLLLTAFVYLSGASSVSRVIVVFSGILNIATLTAWRLLRRHIVRQRVLNGIGARNVLVIGAGRVGRALAGYFDENPHLGYVVKGFLDQHTNGDDRVLGSIRDLPRVARAHFADEIFVTIPQHRTIVKQIALEAMQRQPLVMWFRNCLTELAGTTASINWGISVLELYREPTSELGLFAKRAFDAALSAIFLILVSPLLAILAIAIRIDSPGPAFYSASRVGRKGRLFTCYKLRTMGGQDADFQKERLRHLNERNGPFFKIADDPRVTRLGRWLRKYSFDELPQLWNVIKGDMSLVGPRPHPLDDYKQYDLDHLRRLDVRPGVTGLWQVTARRESSFVRRAWRSIFSTLKTVLSGVSFSKILMKIVPEVLRASGN